jgi:pyrroloquinoline quinone biosynthesis protein B
LHVLVLGSAAGGGFPQWNCGCENCAGFRAGRTRARRRTQESVALSSDGRAWFLVNASPDISQQLERAPALFPRALRDSPIEGIFLTNGDLDHCLGLFSLRESQRLKIYATEVVRRGIVEENTIYRTLERFPGQCTWTPLVPGKTLALEGGLEVTPVEVPGKRPLHLEAFEASTEDNVGLVFREPESGVGLGYLPAVGAISTAVREVLSTVDGAFFDGTFWSDDELTSLGLGKRTATDMAHWPLSGSEGGVELLRQFALKRRILIHINNTNPILREDSQERALVEAAGCEVAYDGMEVRL